MGEVITKELNIDKILSIKFDFGTVETLNSLEIGFKKVVNTAQYETETFDLKSTVAIPNSLTGIQLMLIDTIVIAQLEYGVLCKIWERGNITDDMFKSQRSHIEKNVSSVFVKALQLKQDLSFIVE